MKETTSDEVKASEGAALTRLITRSGARKVDVESATGVAGSFLKQIELGIRPMNLEHATKLARFFEVTLDDISPRLASIARDASAMLAKSQVSKPPQSPNVTEITAKAPSQIWPFQTVTIERYYNLKNKLGTRVSKDAYHDIDSTLESAVLKWELKAPKSARSAEEN